MEVLDVSTEQRSHSFRTGRQQRVPIMVSGARMRRSLQAAPGRRGARQHACAGPSEPRPLGVVSRAPAAGLRAVPAGCSLISVRTGTGDPTGTPAQVLLS